MCAFSPEEFRIVCVIFVLLEVAVMIILFYLIILPIYQDGLFDRVLKLRGLRHVLKKNEGNDVIKCLRGVHGGLLIVFFQASVRFLPNFDVINTRFAAILGLWMTPPPLTPTPATQQQPSRHRHNPITTHPVLACTPRKQK